MPDAQLVEKDVDARWADSAMRALEEGSAAVALSPAVKADARQRQGVQARATVMFRDAHVRELQPPDWETQVLGRGSYGKVYEATWRGQQIAIKEVRLPEMPR
eukprot:COSAG05_NODE_18457_length_308_cov_0.736842_1_plen_102_part_11